MRTRSIMVAAGMAVAMHGADAQQDSTARGAPAIVLRADVTARAVRFEQQPEIRVTLVGGTLDSVRILERRNLPERVQPGVTYRDVYIAVEIVGRLHAECLAAAITGRDVPSCDRGAGQVRTGIRRDSLATRDTSRIP